jgi:predicted nucleotidyltransferase
MKHANADGSDLAESLAAVFGSLADPGVVSAYLFGSHVVGRPHRESDVDVGVLLDWSAYPSRALRFDARVRLGSSLIAGLHRNEVDVVILNDAPPLFGRRVVTAGRRVFCRDHEADHTFVRDVQIRAADLEPWIRRTRRAKLAAIVR